MGRSGRWFAHQHWDVLPDIITTAKATGGGLPLGAVISRAEVFATFVDPPLSHLTTMGGNPVACAAGIAAFDVIAGGLLEHATEVGEYLRAELRKIQADLPELVVDVRGRGLWCAFELSVDANPVAKVMEQRGVLVGSVLNNAGTIRVMPPLVITTAEVDRFVAVTRSVLEEIA
jgi:acetylornithine/succinyldiaminopimelate/putrescine aminotransferase